MTTHEIDVRVPGISVHLTMNEVKRLKELLSLNKSGDTLKSAVSIILEKDDPDVASRLREIIEFIELIVKTI